MGVRIDNKEILTTNFLLQDLKHSDRKIKLYVPVEIAIIVCWGLRLCDLVFIW